MAKKETDNTQDEKKGKSEWLQVRILEDFQPIYEAFCEDCESKAIDKSKLIRLWITNYVKTGDPLKKGKK
jgi:hypothetical protein